MAGDSHTFHGTLSVSLKSRFTSIIFGSFTYFSVSMPLKPQHLMGAKRGSAFDGSVLGCT